jgi:hypothetical protein
VLEKAKEESLEDFTASHHWLINFKKCHQITSRRITEFVTKHEIEDTAEIQKSARDFVFQAREEMKKFKPNEILNTDQSGIQLEMHSNRTLSFKGEHAKLSRIKSHSGSTHSYTVQPMISMSGELITPTFLCLKEVNDKMSDSKFLFSLTCDGTFFMTHYDYFEAVLRNQHFHFSFRTIFHMKRGTKFIPVAILT